MTYCIKPQFSHYKLSDEAVECYLIEHPDYFEQHPQLLTKLSIPHLSGGAVSLIERQVKLLRQKNCRLERKLLEIVQVARDNEGLSICLYRLALQLIDAQSLKDVIARTEDLLRSEFPSTEVAFLLLSKAGNNSELTGLQTLDYEGRYNGLFAELFRTRRPYCRRLDEEQQQALFGKSGLKITSAAMIPLMHNCRLGIMAVGAENADRFRNRMDTSFLEYLGELVSRSVSAHQYQQE